MFDSSIAHCLVVYFFPGHSVYIYTHVMQVCVLIVIHSCPLLAAVKIDTDICHDVIHSLDSSQHLCRAHAGGLGSQFRSNYRN